MGSTLNRCEFEIFGKVQGVHFRKYTYLEAKKLGLRGFCMNTSDGTVVGTIEGPKEKVELMKRWLQRKGSPKSIITKTIFNNEAIVTALTYTDFRIQK